MRPVSEDATADGCWMYSTRRPLISNVQQFARHGGGNPLAFSHIRGHAFRKKAILPRDGGAPQLWSNKSFTIDASLGFVSLRCRLRLCPNCKYLALASLLLLIHLIHAIPNLSSSAIIDCIKSLELPGY